MRKVMLGVAVAAAVATGAWAMARGGAAEDRIPVAEQFAEMMDTGRAGAALEAKLATQARREASSLNVGDPDSFGRNVRWLGAMSSPSVVLRTSCEPQPYDPPGQRCAQVDPASPSIQRATFDDLATITLPARSMNSLLCHWLTPTAAVQFANFTGMDNRTGRVIMYPKLTVENPVFNEPGLIDPVTGEPIVGKVDMAMTSLWTTAPLDDGDVALERNTSTRTCIGGFVTKRVLMEGYGLSEQQADRFFASPTTLSVGMDVLAGHVSNASLILSVRFVGD